MSLDLSLFYVLNNLAGRNSIVDGSIIFLASYLPYLLVGGFAIYLYLKKRLSLQEKLVIFCSSIIAALVARGFVSVIRFFYPRPRPFVNHQVHQLIAEHSPSFPSGHASFFFGFSTVIFLYNRKIGLLFFLLTAIVCAARVAAGIHYPSDMLAGWVVGVLCGCLLYTYSFRYLRLVFSRLHIG